MLFYPTGGFMPPCSGPFSLFFVGCWLAFPIPKKSLCLTRGDGAVSQRPRTRCQRTFLTETCPPVSRNLPNQQSLTCHGVQPVAGSPAHEHDTVVHPTTAGVDGEERAFTRCPVGLRPRLRGGPPVAQNGDTRGAVSQRKFHFAAPKREAQQLNSTLCQTPNLETYQLALFIHKRTFVLLHRFWRFLVLLSLDFCLVIYSFIFFNS